MPAYHVTFENPDNAQSPHIVQVHAQSQEEAVEKARFHVREKTPFIILGKVLEVDEVPVQ